MSLQSQLDQLMAEFHRTTQAVDAVTQRLNDSSHTKRSANRMVSATVDSKGELTDLTFHTTAYRAMAPRELGTMLLSLIKEVRAAAQAEVQAAVSGFMPPGSGILGSVAEGKALDRDSIFGELEQVFAWGKNNAPAAEPARPERAEDGWSGDRREPDAKRAAPAGTRAASPSARPSDEGAEEGWTGKRRDVAKPARTPKRASPDR